MCVYELHEYTYMLNIYVIQLSTMKNFDGRET